MPCMVLVMASTIWIGLYEDLKCYTVKYTIMLMSLNLMEINDDLKVQEFQ